MSKQIRLDDEVYTELEGLLKPRETFSQVVARLLEVHHLVYRTLSVITPNPEHLRSRVESATTRGGDNIDVVGTDFEGRPLIQRPTH